MKPCLLLNATYEPLKIIDWQKAVIMYFTDKVSIVEEEDIPLRSPSFEMKMPSVVALRQYCRVKKQVKFSRRNVLIRDSYRCQYCGTKDGEKHPIVAETVFINVDHVLPKSKGGKTSWKNCVAACQFCNNKKGDRETNPYGFTLNRKPYTPVFVTFQLTKKKRQIPDKWKRYCFMDHNASSHWTEDSS